jgi:dihydrofolate reductase
LGHCRGCRQQQAQCGRETRHEFLHVVVLLPSLVLSLEFAKVIERPVCSVCLRVQPKHLIFAQSLTEPHNPEGSPRVPDISLILAMAGNGVIGDRGAIPWRLPQDMRRFKALTLGKPNIMGRKTWESLPKKPLPGRTNIIVTGDRNYRAEGATVVATIQEALGRAKAQDPEEIMVIGGAQIYRAALPLDTRVHLTEIHTTVEGDTTFTFDRADWNEVAREDHKTEDGLSYSFVTLER